MSKTAVIVSVEVIVDADDVSERFKQVIAEGRLRELLRRQYGIRILPKKATTPATGKETT
uniref:Uncharacterized protein n=1 Tax=viral metagenome TaxID=1070528 RepID=A0A6M3LVP9_9ZZZZ